MKKDEYKLVYTETIDVVKFFLKTKKKDVIKSVVYDNATATNAKYSELSNDREIKKIRIFKNDKSISFIELITDVKLERAMMLAAIEDRCNYTYFHIDNIKDERLFSVQVDEKSNAELIDIDVEKVMSLLDASSDFNIAFKLLDEAIRGFKYFTIEDIGIILDGCFTTCRENNIVKVVI